MWFRDLDLVGEVRNLPHELLRGYLEQLGANFENEEAFSSLEAYGNKSRRGGMDIVWGRERTQQYQSWCREWVAQYETQEGNVRLPRLVKKDGNLRSYSETSGMLQFFGQLTAYAAGVLDFYDFARFTEARLHNGKMWQEGRKNERIRVQVPTDENPKLLSSIPPGFIHDFTQLLESWRKS